jgi:molybdate transport repressor ModE-like protein
MAFTLALRWLLDGAEVDPRVLGLLEAIARRGSLQQATRDVGLSYRHAWELLGRFESALGRRVVELERGRGATLTDAGAKLAGHAREIEKRLEPEVKRAAADLNRLAVRASAPATAQAIGICASHDLALGRLAELLPRRGGPAVELHFQGSVDALAALARGKCDVAGFHVADIGDAALLDAYRPLLKSPGLRAVHFVDRTQGLMVARGNPLGIATLADVARKRARFVNRQPGSGTRILLDVMLAAQRISPRQVIGYHSEEFTHAAVAALVASGAADAGFGIEAAAAQHGLAFIPVARERYFLAARDSALAKPGLQALVEALSSRWFRTIVRGLPGYALPPHAEVIPAARALERETRETYTMRSAKTARTSRSSS